MSPNKHNIEDTIAVFAFPLPSPSNYVLLANLMTILSHLYTRVIVVAGGITKYFKEVISETMHAKNNIYICDIGLKLPQREYEISRVKRVLTYIKIQIRLISIALKISPGFRVALFFIGIPHLLIVIVLLRLLRKRLMVY